MSWTQAKAEGKTKSIDWGSRCDTTTGTLKYPTSSPASATRPFNGDNGGATYHGRHRRPRSRSCSTWRRPNDPILKYIEGSIADTDTNQQTADTVKDWINFFQTYYETYGRKVDLVPFAATGDVDRRGGGPGRRHHHRRDRSSRSPCSADPS